MKFVLIISTYKIFADIHLLIHRRLYRPSFRTILQQCRPKMKPEVHLCAKQLVQGPLKISLFRSKNVVHLSNRGQASDNN